MTDQAPGFGRATCNWSLHEGMSHQGGLVEVLVGDHRALRDDGEVGCLQVRAQPAGDEHKLGVRAQVQQREPDPASTLGPVIAPFFVAYREHPLHGMV